MFVFLLSEPLPPSITTLLADRAKVQGQFKSHPARWRVSHRRLPFLFKDSPSASFYRIYQFLVLDMNTQLRNELEYFCTVHSDWSVADLPDPTDTHDPGRYAALAALTYLLCEAFNRRVELGLPRDAPPIVEDWEELARRPKVLEHVPTWATNVRPLNEVLRIPDAQGRYLGEDGSEVCELFKGMDILIRQAHIHFV